MTRSNGKKQKTGHYSNNVYYGKQPNRFFTPGTSVVEKKTGHKYIVLEKIQVSPRSPRSPRSLIRVENMNTGTIKYIRSDLLHTENYNQQIVNNNLKRVKCDKPERKKRPFVKNTDIIEFKKNRKEFNELLKSYDNIKKTGGGVSVDYSTDNRGVFYIHSIGNPLIDKYNEKNLEVIKYRYDNLNNNKNTNILDHHIPKSRIIDIFMKDSTGSTNNLVPDCCSKSDFYIELNKYIANKYV